MLAGSSSRYLSVFQGFMKLTRLPGDKIAGTVYRSRNKFKPRLSQSMFNCASAHPSHSILQYTSILASSPLPSLIGSTSS